MGTVKFETLDDRTNTISADAIIYGTPRVWNHFDGTVPSITNSFNVSSLTDINVGVFTTNLTSNLTVNQYAIMLSAGERIAGVFPGGAESGSSVGGQADSSSAFTTVTNDNDSNTKFDFIYTSTAVVGP